MAREKLPRYTHGHGEPPRYLAQVRPEAGELRFAGGGKGDVVVAFAGEAALAALLARLLAARVPLGHDHRIDGPAELAERLVEAGSLPAPLIRLEWSGPGRWALREWWPDAVTWRAADATEFARLDFDPAELDRSPSS